MDLTLQIIAVGDTTPREISAASRDVRDALGRVPGIARIQPRQVAAPDQSKGGLADTLGEFAISAAPTAVKAALQILQAVLSRHPPAKFMIQNKDAQISFEYDPRKNSLQDLVECTVRLCVAAGAFGRCGCHSAAVCARRQRRRGTLSEPARGTAQTDPEIIASLASADDRTRLGTVVELTERLKLGDAKAARNARLLLQRHLRQERDFLVHAHSSPPPPS